jgi:hypothetical protein
LSHPIEDRKTEMTERFDRREFGKRALASGAAVLGGSRLLAADTNEPLDSVLPLPQGKAQSCIFLWLGGGMCHLDTLDPKRMGDPASRKAGSAYAAIPTAIDGVKVCEHLKQTADILDRGALLRTVHHQVIAEHAAPSNLFKTGRMTSDTVVYPSIGSIVSHQRGPRVEGTPAYVVMGYPNVTRGPGFLGSKHSYIYLTDTKAGPNGLRRPADITDARQSRRQEVLSQLRSQYIGRHADEKKLKDYDAAISESFRLAGPKFTQVFELDREPADLRNRYGDEFGQRCLLARRLVQSGVRFVEVSFNLNFINGTGWDTHNEGQREQHVLIQNLDQALAALIEDLEQNKLLDETLVVLATEFGRPAEFDGGGGRGHQATAFSTALFGGGLKTGQVIGETDEWGKNAVDSPIPLPDWHATIHAALGIDPGKELFAGDRPVPITDHGRPIAKLFA